MSNYVWLFAPRYPPNGGGAAVYFRQVARLLQQTEYRPVVITIRHRARPERDVDGVTPVFRLYHRHGNGVPGHVGTAMSVTRSLPWLLRHAPPRLVHAHPHFPYLRHSISMLPGVPVLYDCRDLSFHRYYDIRHGRTPCWLSSSEAVDHLLQSEFDIESEAIIRSGLVQSSLVRNTEPKQDVETDTFRCLYVGRLAQFKGVPVIVQAFRELSSDYELHIVGTGPLRPTVQTVAARDSQIHYHGELSHQETIEQMRRSNCLTLASNSETPYARVSSEAIDVGTPVISTPAGEVRDVIGEAGRIIDRTPESLAAAIRGVKAEYGRYKEAALNRESITAAPEELKSNLQTAYQRAIES